MAVIDKILRKSNFTAAMNALVTALNGIFVRKEDGKGLSANDFTTEEKEKLAGIAEGANNYSLPTASDTTLGGVKIGENVQITKGVISVDLSGKVDKVEGKGLSTNDFTTAEKTKLAGVAEGANKYVLPVASASVLGGVKAGKNITIAADGTLSADQQKIDLSPYAKTADIEETYAKKSDLTTVYKYRGSVDTYADLPVNGQTVGDVYNVVAADTANGINAGDNVAWNGNSWDNLSGVVDLSAYAKAADVDKTYMKINDFPLATDDEIVAIVNETVK